MQKNEKVITAVKGWKHLDNRELPLHEFKVLFWRAAAKQTNLTRSSTSLAKSFTASIGLLVEPKMCSKLKGKKKLSFQQKCPKPMLQRC